MGSITRFPAAHGRIFCLFHLALNSCARPQETVGIACIEFAAPFGAVDWQLWWKQCHGTMYLTELFWGQRTTDTESMSWLHGTILQYYLRNP